MRLLTSIAGFGARFCLRCVGRFLLWGLWLLLSTTLILELWIACSHELRLPVPLIRVAERLLSRDGFLVRLGAVSFDPSGHLVVRDFELRLASLDEPVLRGALLSTRVDPWGAIVGSPEANQLEVSGIELLYPSALSPTGASEAYVSSLDARVRVAEGQLHLRQLTARSGQLSVIAEGSLQLRNRQPGGHLAVSDLQERLVGILRLIARFQPRLAALQGATLELRLSPSTDHTAIIAARLHADQLDLRDSIGLETGPLFAETTLPLTGDAPFLLGLEARTGQLRLPKTELKGLQAHVTARCTPSTLTMDQVRAELSASSIEAGPVSIEGVSATVQPETFTRLNARVIASADGALLDADAKVDLASDSAHVNFEIGADNRFIGLLSRIAGRDIGEYTSLDRGTWGKGEADLGPNWKINYARAWVAGDNVVIYHVPFDRVYSRVFFDGKQFLADRASLRVDRSEAGGSYWMAIPSLDYRFLLDGRLQPPRIKGWFTDWWMDFWDSFQFPHEVPWADIDIVGRWFDNPRLQLFVGIDAARPTVRNVTFESVHTRMHVTSTAVNVLHFDGQREDGNIEGWFTRVHPDDNDDHNYVDYDIQGKVRVDAYAAMLSNEDRARMPPLTFHNPVLLRSYGHLESESGRGTTMNLFLDSNGEASLLGYGLEYLSVEGRIKGPLTTLSSVRARFAGGVLEGHASITDQGTQRLLNAEGTLKDAQLANLATIVEQRNARAKGREPDPTSDTQKRLAGIGLNLQFDAAGKLEDPLSFTGHAKLQLSGELVQVRLLGGLSQLLRFTSLRFTSLKSDLELDHERLKFTEARITGHNSAIDANGVVDLKAGSLDFNAKVWPFDESNGLLGSTMGLVLSPLSHAFEVKLGGSYSNPKWSFFYNPLRILSQEAPAPAKVPMKEEVH
jgi:hypothetical protein